jgi:eukaryotic-like serine/threonine-protein kinase
MRIGNMAVLAKEIEATYEVLAKMGEGGMGSVYKVRHRFFDEIRVIKIMQAELQAVDELKERFLGEAKRGKQLRHPNLAEVLDFSITEDGTAYIVMEYIDGINLRQLLQRKDGPLDYRTVIPIAQQALDALGFLHSKKFVHRDISPDNLMLTRDGDVERVKLIDLGIAKSLESTRHLTMAGKFLGKLQYASPEQFGGEVDARSDIYSFGLVLYELLTNERPITGDSLSLIRGHVSVPPRPFTETDPGNHVPLAVRAAVLKALEKNPADRFQDAAEFAEALNAALGPRRERTVVEETLVTNPRPIVAPEPIGATQVSTPVIGRTLADPVPASPQRRSHAAMAVVAVLLLAGAAAILLLRRDPQPVPQPVPKKVVAAQDTIATATVTVEAPVAATGQLLVNALPWGYVASVRDEAGGERLTGNPVETPLLLSLPAGQYKVRLTNPYSDRTVVLDATVAADELSRVESDLDRVDVASYIDALGSENR